MKHTLTNRTIPPLLVIAVITCVWYSLESRPQQKIVVPTAEKSTTQPPQATVAHAQAAPDISPTVQKLGTQLQFSVNPNPYAHVQKVEFYVESQFVGTAYSKPYSVAVSENNLTAGQHTVTAKIYTTDDTAQSQPATFMAKPTAPPAPAADVSDTTDTTAAIPPADDTSTVPTSPAPLATPTGIITNATDDGTSATLNWQAVDGAARYQIWRDGAQVATSTGTGYTDTGLNPGQTYDYQVVAVATAGGTSDLSDAVAVTMPTPQDTSPVNGDAPQSTQTQQDSQALTAQPLASDQTSADQTAGN